MKKALVIAIIAIALILGGVLFYLKGKRHEVIITQQQIDTTLAEKFPATKRYFAIFNITFSDPKVVLLEASNRIQIGLTATLDIGLKSEQKTFAGTCLISSGLRYDSSEKAFYLADAEFDQIELQGVPQEWLDKATAVAGRAAREFVEGRPVYRLTAKDAKTAAAKLLLKDMQISDQKIYISLGL